MSRGGEKMADKNTTSNINLAAAEELASLVKNQRIHWKRIWSALAALLEGAWI